MRGAGDPFHEEAMAGERRLPWDAFSDWLHAIAVVTFDLELGQALEVSFVPLSSLSH